MTVTRRIAVVEDPRYLEHVGPDGHPERPARLVAVGEALAARRERLTPLAPRPASEDEIARVHPRSHLELLREAVRQAPARLDADTYVSPASFDVALLAAGGAIEAARSVARGEADAALAAVRPPGHHAEAQRAMGFCLLNNAAIAARALADDGVERVLILDWDVHHGNGTQHVFEDDPDVLYLSTHQFPFYPGTGDFGEVGVGRGEGATVNLPLPPGCADADYVGLFHRVVAPVVRSFRPELILVSCGFDAHRDDPLASMELSGEGFAELTRIVRALAEDVCGGRVVLLLEGGYAASGLRESTGAVLDVLLEPETPALAPEPEAPAGSTPAQVTRLVARAHPGRFGIHAGA